MRAARIKAAIANLKIGAEKRQSEIQARPPWKCAACGCEKVATAHQRRQVYCSKECMAVGYAKRMTGAVNPNYRSAGAKACQHCGASYQNYSKASKFCSMSCRNKARAKPKADKPQKPLKAAKPEKVKFVRVRHYRDCLQCKKTFQFSPSTNKQYCSYQCHLDSGGAQRAGKASGTMTRKYGARKDANHSEIVNAFRKLGSDLIDMSNMGCGVPDLVVWCQRAWHLVDIKNPNTGYGRRGLNERQKEWAADWKGGPVYLISSVEQAADLVNGKLDGLKRFPE